MEIPNPCPILMMRLQKEGDDTFFCGSCKKQVTDYRGCSRQELETLKGKNVCGIFDRDQLTNQKQYGFRHRVVFTALGILSFLGFAVQPLKAQTQWPMEAVNGEPFYRPVKEVPKPVIPEGASEKKKARLMARYERQKRRFGPVPMRPIMGCPKF